MQHVAYNSKNYQKLTKKNVLSKNGNVVEKTSLCSIWDFDYTYRLISMRRIDLWYPFHLNISINMENYGQSDTKRHQSQKRRFSITSKSFCQARRRRAPCDSRCIGDFDGIMITGTACWYFLSLYTCVHIAICWYHIFSLRKREREHRIHIGIHKD